MDDEYELIIPGDRKVRYEVSTFGLRCTVKCILPNGFSMSEFTRVFNLKDCHSLGMNEAEYIEWNVAELKTQLLQRLPLDEQKLLS